MTKISRTFTVEAPPHVVLDYLKDFSNAEEWDPGTQECRRLDDGPVQVGSRWHNVSSIAGVTTELEYRLVELNDSRVEFAGENDSSTTTDTIDVLPHGSGSEITYEADIRLKGAGKLATPVVKLVFEKIGSQTRDDLIEILDRLPRDGA